MTEVLTYSESFGWKINPYDGCSHGCLYCYGMSITKKSLQDFRIPHLRKNLIERLKKDIKNLQRAETQINDVFVGTVCDAYQPIESSAKQTLAVLRELIANSLPFTVLTKSALALRDIDLFKSYSKMCRVGFTITSLDENFRATLEPSSNPVNERISALRELKRQGVSTYCSVEPMFPVEECDPIAIVQQLSESVDLFEFGMWNPKPETLQYMPERFRQNMPEAFYVKLFKDIYRFCEENKVNFCTSSHSKRLLEQAQLPFKLTPNVLKRTKGGQQSLAGIF